MIEITIKAENNQVATRFNKKDVVLNDIGMTLFELEKVKKELLEIDIEYDFEVNEE